jgi:hypothetical protein
MLISATLLGESLTPVFEYHTELDPLPLMAIAESREGHLRYKGAEWAAASVSQFGKAFINTLSELTTSSPNLQKEVADIVMALWLYQSLFMNVKAESFSKANLELLISPDGTVKSTSHRVEE